jgi:predicted MFS family arabinose efflux permease
LDSKAEGGEPEENTKQQYPLRQVLFTKSFWAVLFIWLVMAFSSFFIMTHIVPHATDIGFSPVESATILSLGGIAMIAGRLFAGITTDRVSAKGVAIASSLVQAAAIFSLVWARELWMLYLFGIIHGLTFGSFGTSITVLIGRTFSLNDIGKVLGILEVGIFIGGAIGPYLGGFIFDTTESYSLAFLIMAGMALLRILIVTLIKPKAEKYVNT